MSALAAVDTAGFTLARYDAACRAVADAKSIDEVKSFRDQAEAMRAYAKQAKNRQLEIDASEIRIRAERRIGELMAGQKEAGLLNKGGGDGSNQHKATGLQSNPVAWAPRDIEPSIRPITLAEAGIDKNLADRARKYAAVPEAKFEGILAERRDRIEQENERVGVSLLDEAAKHVRGTFGTGENEWYTPVEYIELARAVMGGIDLDPASCAYAQKAVQATTYFTEDDDGLLKRWFGRIWLNPPYAQPAMGLFMDKLVTEWRDGGFDQAIILTNNYTDTGWFHQLAVGCSAICFTRGRIRFVSPRGEANSPVQGQAFFYFGHDADRFAKTFKDTGFIVEVRT